MTFLAGLGNAHLEFVAINDLTAPKSLAHLLKYDSVHGRFAGEVGYTDRSLIVNGKEIPVTAVADPEQLPWGAMRVDLVFECTGRFLNRTVAAKHLKAGARKVLLSAPHKCTPSEERIKTIVLGVNDKELKPADAIISNASCTTNCFAPLAKVLHDNFSMKHGSMITVHAYTSTQHVVDGPDKDLRRARAAAVNIIPTHSGASEAISQVIPALSGKFSAQAVRVPVADGSICYFVAVVDKKVDAGIVNRAFQTASQGNLNAVIRYTDEPIVSSDIIHDPHSCIFDAGLTVVEGGHLVTVAAWYDNEWGYSCRMIDIGLLMFKR